MKHLIITLLTASSLNAFAGGTDTRPLISSIDLGSTKNPTVASQELIVPGMITLENKNIPVNVFQPKYPVTSPKEMAALLALMAKGGTQTIVDPTEGGTQTIAAKGGSEDKPFGYTTFGGVDTKPVEGGSETQPIIAFNPYFGGSETKPLEGGSEDKKIAVINPFLNWMENSKVTGNDGLQIIVAGTPENDPNVPDDEDGGVETNPSTSVPGQPKPVLELSMPMKGGTDTLHTTGLWDTNTRSFKIQKVKYLGEDSQFVFVQLNGSKNIIQIDANDLAKSAELYESVGASYQKATWIQVK